jgi:AcrR family transcriptional regulator
VEATRRRLPAAERRARIAEAATQVFAERGYADASMAEIASRAGVVASVIYDHYGSKRELAVELLEQHGAAIVARTITGVEEVDPREQVRRSIELVFEFMEEDPFVWRFLFRDPPTDPEIAEVHRRVHDLAAAGIADMVRRTVPPQPLFGGIPYQRATMMIARASQQSTQGLARWWFENRDVPREEVVEVAYRVLWDGARGMLEDPGIRASRG